MSRYSDLLITQGATNHWSLDETIEPYMDSIGGVHLTYAENARSELAVVHTGLVVNNSGYIRSLAENTITFDGASGFSCTYIANFTNFNVNRGILSKRQNTTLGRTFTSFVFNSGTGSGLSFDLGNAGSRWTTGFYPPTGEWVHIAYTYDAATLTGSAYMNGQLIQTYVYPTAPTSTAADSTMLIGGLQSSITGAAGSLMTGSIDEVALFTRKTLTHEEILTQYATAFPITRIFDGTNWHDADKRVIS